MHDTITAAALQNPFMTMAARPADPVRCASSVPTAVRVFGHGDVLAKLELELTAAVAVENAHLRKVGRAVIDHVSVYVTAAAPNDEPSDLIKAAFMKPLLEVLNRH